MHIKEEFSVEQVIQKSRFISWIKPCKTEEQARAFIEEIRKMYPDASHVCTAYVCGEHNEIQRSSDNKEPSGTAGIPMLEAIRNSGVTDVCACVVRYFGGIKLGTGGLARAYSSSVTNALQASPKTETILFEQYSITYPYTLSGTLENWLRRNTVKPDFLYDENVTCLFLTQDTDICAAISNLTSGAVTPERIRSIETEVDIEA